MDQIRFFITEYKTGRFSVTELAHRFGISRQTAHYYIKRYRTEGMKCVAPKSRAPVRKPTKTSEDIESEILALHRKKKGHYGARKIRNILARQNPEITYPPVSTVHNILLRNGRTKVYRPRRRIKPANVFFEASAPNQIWSTDYKGQFRLCNSRLCYPLTLCDNFSRYILGIKGHYGTRTKDAKALFTWAFREYGLPDAILSDNGAPFVAPAAPARLSQLAVWWIKLGITPIHIDPGCPSQNGKHERMHKDLKAWTATPPAGNMAAQQRKFNDFRIEYNDNRPHEALGDRTPWEFYHTSEREYTGKFVDFAYPKDFIVRRVTRNGAIRWPGDGWISLTTTLNEEYVGLEPIDTGLFCVWFHRIRLGYFHEKRLRVVDQFDRFIRNRCRIDHPDSYRKV